VLTVATLIVGGGITLILAIRQPSEDELLIITASAVDEKFDSYEAGIEDMELHEA